MTPLLRFLGRVVLIVYVLVVIVVLGFRYWLLPNIDQWRQPISQWLSSATHTQIEIGQLQAQWTGLLPQLQLNNVLIKESGHPQPLHIPQLKAQFKWSSLLAGSPHFSYLKIDGLHLSVWRDQAGQFHVVGQPVDATSSQKNTQSPFLRWLTQQDYIELKDAQLQWQDFSRDDQAVLVIQQLNGVLKQQAHSLHYSLAGQLASDDQQRWQLQGELYTAALQQEQLSGPMYMQLDNLRATDWRSWLAISDNLVQAQLDTKVKLQLEQGVVEWVTVDSFIKNAQWRSVEWGDLYAQQMRVYAHGSGSSVDQLLQSPDLEALEHDLQLELYMGGVKWWHADHLVEPVYANELVLRAHTTSTDAQPRIYINELYANNADFRAKVHGSWTAQGHDLSLAQWDLIGQAERIQLNSIYKYFPTSEIPLSVIEWLQQSLKQGQAPSASLRMQGNWEQFPYEQADQGLFFVGGQFEQATVDYYPSTADEKGWPAIEAAQGYLSIHGKQLQVQKAQGLLKPNQQDPVYAQNIQVDIDDLDAEEPLLTVQAQTYGAAQHYLPLMQTTELGDWLGHAFDQSTATGNWRVPLWIQVNLEHEDQVAVKGAIEFEQNQLQLWPQLPPLKGLTGQLAFNEHSAHSQQLQAQWLGGTVSLTGSIGAADQQLQLQGRLQSNELLSFYELVDWQNYLEGPVDYKARIGLDAQDQVHIRAQTNLQGLSSRLPAPLAKTADQQWPLQVQWQPVNAQQHELVVQADHGLKAHLIENVDADPVFVAGALAWGAELPSLDSTGLKVVIGAQNLDLDAWYQLLAEPLPIDSKPQLVAPVQQLQLQAQQLKLFNRAWHQVEWQVQRPQPQSWQMQIQAAEAQGQVQWQTTAQGKVNEVINANFTHLYWPAALDEHSEAESSAWLDPNSRLQLPDLSLSVQQLDYEQKKLGTLHLQGRSEPDAMTKEPKWYIPVLQLYSPYASVSATGYWQTAGANRGLYLDLQAQSTELAQQLEYVGFENKLSAAYAHADAALQWKNFPWNTSLDYLKTQLSFSLEQGRLHQVNSIAAKTLELLSLQSLSRLSRLDLDVRGLLKEGFPFDQIQGEAALAQHKIDVDKITVVGPVGTLLLEGQSDLNDQSVDLRAVVVPQLDMSGAAIAAGIALNPIVGVSAFLTQWLLKTPLANVMTAQYQLQGPWDHIEFKELPAKP